jgi:hypothetical protein
MAGAFMPSAGDEEPGANEFTVSTVAPTRRPASSSKKAPDWTENFNAKDMAKGLQTVLNKEKEG